MNYNIPVELTWQANHCQLKEKIKAIKLTINPMVGQPSETKDGAAEIYPVYGVPDLSRFYDEP